MPVYEGNQDYIFVSYARKDSPEVLPIISSLQRRGLRIWYDTGIEPGSEWSELIAEHIDGCKAFLVFMSDNASASTNCRREIHYATETHSDKYVLVVYLNRTQLSPGMKMRLNPLQALKRWKFESEEALVDSIANVRTITSCVEEQSMPIDVERDGKTVSSSTELHSSSDEQKHEPSTPKRVGWGPARRTFTNESPAPYPTFNSITNNSGVGDERAFCRIREANSKMHFSTKPMQIIPGKRYEVYVYYQNDTTIAGENGIARDTRIRSTFPAQITPRSWFGITATVSSSNANPPAVWDGCDLWASVPVQLRYIPESAMLHRGSKQMPLSPDDLFGKQGALIGCDKLDGLIPGDTGKESNGYVTYAIEAESWIQRGNGSGGSVEKLASSDGEVFGKRIVAAPGDEVTFKLVIRNDGDIKMFNATAKDELPEGMELVPGSVELRANESKSADKLSDSIAGPGFFLGVIGAKNVVYITYRAKIDSVVPIGIKELESMSILSYDGYYHPSIAARDSAFVRIESHLSGEYLFDPIVLGNTVDALIASKHKVLPPFDTGELGALRESAIKELDERIGLAIFGSFTESQNQEFNNLLDRDNATEQDFNSFFSEIGLDVEAVARKTIEEYAKEFNG